MNYIRKELGKCSILLRNIPSLIVSIFIVSVIMMNILANKELFATEYFAFDCGTCLSWIPFLCMDIIAARFGAGAAARISILAIAFNLLCSVIFKLLSMTPGHWGAYYSADPAAASAVNDAINNTIGGSWYIVIMSCIAMLAGSLTKAAILSLVNRAQDFAASRDSDDKAQDYAKDKGHGFLSFAVSSYSSTLIGQFIDNFVFTLAVSQKFFGWSMKQVVICAACCALFELLCGIFFSPIAYRLAHRETTEL